jgi:hypothetical protein
VRCAPLPLASTSSTSSLTTTKLHHNKHRRFSKHSTLGHCYIYLQASVRNDHQFHHHHPSIFSRHVRLRSTQNQATTSATTKCPPRYQRRLHHINEQLFLIIRRQQVQHLLFARDRKVLQVPPNAQHRHHDWQVKHGPIRTKPVLLLTLRCHGWVFQPLNATVDGFRNSYRPTLMNHIKHRQPLNHFHWS